ncbi:GCN5-related N-acetyltransferase [Paenibacillus algicola]|uniref:GCN5-related N-acetyltransferase n=1 Tax=Paenibacillus algicola TaxID=2565926 RepID=A0A4P8XMN0_9BACL|nr:GNAT family N-acetyltransferase [Paenibacillus algicola]QCT02801.1 GCN5-related N-acetyltransferase [Paenibacillus algicola]
MFNNSTAFIETSSGVFTLAPAEAGEEGMMLQVLVSTAEEMVRQARHQWTPALFDLNLMEQYLSERSVFLLKHEGEPAGMFTIQESDPSYWQDRNDTRYHYLHRLAVLPRYRGFELGRQMIAFAERRSREQGKAGLRLDCVTHLQGLNDYYLRLGYQFVAMQDMGGRTVNLYQKQW